MIPKWGEITVAELASVCGGTLVRGEALSLVSGMSTDSRTLKPGDLFVALSGPRFDGHSFVSHVLSAGAAGVIVSADKVPSIEQQGTVIAVADPLASLGRIARWWRNLHRITVAAVTGSAGKTSTKEMAALVMETVGSTLKTEGNLNNLIGVPMTLLRIRPEHEYAVVEMGMNRPGEIASLTGMVDPALGLITNVGMAHLEGLGTLRGVAHAKWELAEVLRPEASMLINGDDEELLLCARESGRDVITFGTGPGNRFRALEIEDRGIEGIRFRIACDGSSCPVKLHCAGIHHVMNALGAVALGVTAGASLRSAAAALGGFSHLKGRFLVSKLQGGIMLVDDTYNANPSSLQAALGSVSGLVGKKNRLLVGLGSMAELGSSAAGAHLEAGRLVAGCGAARFWAWGDYASKMIDGAVQAGMPPGCAEISESHEQMASGIRKAMQPGDVIFIKGSRSAAMEQVVDMVAAAAGGGTALSQNTLVEQGQRDIKT